uniref:Rab GTPase 43 n=1 Tax=Euplotoides octocarinatus TaxID=2716877 RepID=B0FYL4_EUPOC|nr:Rab GTPase 43 [Euplotes octocarinatus]
MAGKDGMKNVTMKVVLIGDSGVGKTTLINKYVTDTFDAFEPPTISGGFRKKPVELKDLNVRVTLQIWDTAGQEKFKAIVSNYYRDAHCAVVMYDVTCEESFQSAKNWIYEVKSKAPENSKIFLCGGKLDLEDKREVSLQAGHRLAKEHGCLFGENSAKTSIGVVETFEKIARVYVENNASASSSPERGTVTLDNKKSAKSNKKSGCKC